MDLLEGSFRWMHRSKGRTSPAVAHKEGTEKTRGDTQFAMCNHTQQTLYFCVSAIKWMQSPNSQLLVHVHK